MKLKPLASLRILAAWTILVVSPLHAQSQGTLTSELSSDLPCPASFEQSVSLNVCASKDFERKAFRTAKGSQRCKPGYKRMPAAGFCVLNNAKLEISVRDDVLMLRKSDKRECRAGFQRMSGSRFCVDSQLALHLDKGQPRFQRSAKIDCKGVGKTDAACASRCAPGYIRPKGVGICVEYKLALSGHSSLSGPLGNCSKSTYWKKVNADGFCVPSFRLGVVNGAQGATKIAFKANTGDCDDGEVAQLTFATIPTTAQASSGGGVGGIILAPTILCSPPGVDKAN